MNALTTIKQLAITALIAVSASACATGTSSTPTENMWNQTAIAESAAHAERMHAERSVAVQAPETHSNTASAFKQQTNSAVLGCDPTTCRPPNQW